MKLYTTITTFSAAFISVLTSFGVAVHDTHAGQLVSQSGGRPTVVTYRGADDHGPQPLGGGQHAHVDYNPLSHSLSNTFSYQSPSIAPRRNSHHKELLRQIQMPGRHAFDNTNLPVLES